jgi:hypothetical protein
VELGEDQKALRNDVKALIEAQKRNDERFARADHKFDSLLAALLRQRPNGRHRS